MNLWRLQRILPGHAFPRGHVERWSLLLVVFPNDLRAAPELQSLHIIQNVHMSRLDLAMSIAASSNHLAFMYLIQVKVQTIHMISTATTIADKHAIQWNSCPHSIQGRCTEIDSSLAWSGGDFSLVAGALMKVTQLVSLTLSQQSVSPDWAG